MASEPQAVPGHDPPAGHESVEMPRPTVAPLVLALGVALVGAGVVSSTTFLVVGIVILATGVGMWVAQLLPGRGHFHEEFAEPALRPKPVTAQPGTVGRLREGMPGYRTRLPEKVHPISAGIKGGILGGLVIPIPAILWGLLSQHHSIWYPINLLAGMMLPGVEQMDDNQLADFNFGFLITALFIHIGTSVIIGMIYGVLLPTLPAIPQAMAWAALAAPVVWTAATYILLGIVNVNLRDGISWPWFILSQFVYGVVMALVVTEEAVELPAIVRGLAGGLLGGALMALPALLWSLGTDRGVWYPMNLLAGMVLPGPGEAGADLRGFHADWFVVALLMHGTLSLGFAVACALLLPKLRPIPSPFAWGGLVMPVLWTGMTYGLMGVVNPVLQDKVSWPWFIISQFAFGMAASVVVIRSEMVYIPPAGAGPDRLSDFVAGQERTPS